MVYNTLKIIKSVWNQLCVATKFLFIIGVISFISTSVNVFYMTSFSEPADIAIRSIMSSIFGFIFGQHMMSQSNFKNRKFQTLAAAFIALLSLLIIISTQWVKVRNINAPLVEIRNLLSTSVGFLISRAKAVDVVETTDDDAPENCCDKNDK